MSTIKTVAVIGGGVAGLAAARLLCLNGVRVKLYEANDKLGGCCASTHVGGYTFNDGALFLAFPGMLSCQRLATPAPVQRDGGIGFERQLQP